MDLILRKTFCISIFFRSRFVVPYNSSNLSSFNSSVRLIRHIFISPGEILVFYIHSSSSNSPLFNSSLRSIRHIFISPRNFLFGLFVFIIRTFDAIIKRYSQLCLSLQDGWIQAVLVVSSTRVRSQTNKEFLSD